MSSPVSASHAQSRAPQPALALTRVTRIHGQANTSVYALNEVSLAVFPGQLVALIGSAGAGKSRVLNLSGGLDTPTTGQIHV